jgi:hypothetical protein
MQALFSISIRPCVLPWTSQRRHPSNRLREIAPLNVFEEARVYLLCLAPQKCGLVWFIPKPATPNQVHAKILAKESSARVSPVRGRRNSRGDQNFGWASMGGLRSKRQPMKLVNANNLVRQRRATIQTAP